MKKILVVMASLVSTSAFAAGIAPGIYAEKNYVVIRSATTQAECKAIEGEVKWDAEEGLCFGRSDNTVEIKKSNTGYKVIISKIGGNLHTCDFEEAAYLSDDGKTLTSRTKVLDYETDQEAVCKVEVKALKSSLFLKNISVVANDNCRSHYCGSGLNLDIEKARKIK